MGTVLSSNLKNTALVYYRERLQSSCKEKSKARPCSDLLSVKSVSESISMFARSLSHVWLVVTAWTIAHRLLCPWDFPGKNTGVGCHFFLQGIFPDQGSNLCLLCLTYWQAVLYHWATWEAPFIYIHVSILYQILGIDMYTPLYLKDNQQGLTV